MPYFVFAWLANIFYAFGNVTAKLSSKHQITNPWLYNFIWTVLMIVFTLPFAIAGGVGLPTHWGSMILLAALSVVSGTLYILALYALDMSVLSPMYSLRTAFGVLLGYFLFHERLVPFQIGCIVVLFVAGFFVTIDEKHGLKSFFRKSILLGLVTVVASALYNASVKYAAQHNGYWEITLWGNLLTMVPLLGTIPLFWKDARKLKLNQLSGVTGSTVFLTIGYFAAMKALSVNMGITLAIISIPLTMVFAFLFSIFAPKLLEKHTLKIYAIRFAAAAVMIVAALKLTN